ncbi:serine hydrolase domain-containing protein [Lentilactobacillus sp. Marseille-Q4993]|uniref:serine hydrolase domain-containing protein n=1 Tax=Lentilactobacillus sp. Marseille-Q4993 TaxID=3039492 RepID=UPI0024BD25B0|nr:serine hydrolase domain-containing protein [Lentilactobacillus sp. Marseille-Q4993]
MEFERTINKIKQGLSNKYFPGVTYAIIDHDRIISSYIGNESLVPTVEPLKGNQTYDLASLTKVIGTTNVIMQLIRSGRLSPEDSVSKYLPEWQSKQTRIRNLLTHTSDIVGYIPHRDQLSKTELKKAILGLKSGDKINQEMRYQDYNFLMLGWIAAKIMGQPIQELIINRVIKPLGMDQTTFHPTDITNVVPTEVQVDGMPLRGTVHDPKTQVLGQDSGAAGLFSTVADLIKFGRVILGQTVAEEVIATETIDKFFIDQTNNQLGIRSFGWVLDEDYGHPVILHTGYTGTLLIFDRSTQRGLIFLSNRVHPTVGDADSFLKYRSELINQFISEEIG